MPVKPLIVLLVASWPLVGLTANWEPLVQDRARVVELDRSTILPSDPGTKVAWARIVVSPEEQEAMGYASVKALNRYDCTGRTFLTTKRVYLDRDNFVLREERVTDPRPLPVSAGSVDERLWRDVCQPPPVKGLRDLAAEASAAAQAARKPPEPPAPVLKAATPPPDKVVKAENGEKAEKALKAEKVEAPQPVLRADYRPEAAPAPAQAAATEVPTPVAPNPVPAAPAPPPKVTVAPAKKVADSSAAPVEPRPPKPVRHAAKPKSAESPAWEPSPEVREAAARAMAGKEKVVLAPRPLPPWSYEGDTGPEHWARLDPEWRACAEGKRQSPIDIRDGIRVDMEPLAIDYRPSAVRVEDTGHTIQVTPADGNVLRVMGRRFELVGLHFHRPSEERVEGRAFDMVAHLVHRDQDGRVGVLAVLLEASGAGNPVIQRIWNLVPLEKKESMVSGEALDLVGLLPAARSYFAYMGSLTTPPCSEDVLWMVLREPVSISDEQLRVFARLYARNIRPIQPLNGRLIKESR